MNDSRFYGGPGQVRPNERKVPRRTAGLPAGPGTVTTLKQDLVDSISREYRWVMAELSSGSAGGSR